VHTIRIALEMYASTTSVSTHVSSKIVAQTRNAFNEEELDNANVLMASNKIIMDNALQ
jgi:hypothetical protein